jgi:hypothetical protein
MTPLRPPRSGAGEAFGDVGAEGATAGGGAWFPAGSPEEAGVPLEGRLRLLRRVVPPAARSGFAVEAGGAAMAGVSGTGLPMAAPPGRRRPRRLRGAAAVAADGCSWGWRSLATTWRLTLAPTSPSAHRAPSMVCRSTRQTTIEVGSPATGGRFWVSVQRA